MRERLWAKYRPRTLDAIVGQPPVRILQQYAARPYPGCILIEGPGGTGKTTAALAFARELGCVDDFSGLYKIASVDLKIDRAQELFRRSLRLRPMMGKGWKVLVIEELEACTSIEVQRFLKVALDVDELPERCIVVATSNGAGNLDKALLQRFRSVRFNAGKGFADACYAELERIWAIEGEGAEVPAAMRQWGWNGGEFSMRTALDGMQVHLMMQEAALV